MHSNYGRAAVTNEVQLITAKEGRSNPPFRKSRLERLRKSCEPGQRWYALYCACQFCNLCGLLMLAPRKLLTPT
jgi:hypothetical protein